ALATHAQRAAAVDLDDGEVVGRLPPGRFVGAPWRRYAGGIQRLGRPALHENRLDGGIRAGRERRDRYADDEEDENPSSRTGHRVSDWSGLRGRDAISRGRWR